MRRQDSHAIVVTRIQSQHRHLGSGSCIFFCCSFCRTMRRRRKRRSVPYASATSCAPASGRASSATARATSAPQGKGLTVRRCSCRCNSGLSSTYVQFSLCFHMRCSLPTSALQGEGQLTVCCYSCHCQSSQCSTSYMHWHALQLTPHQRRRVSAAVFLSMFLR